MKNYLKLFRNFVAFIFIINSNTFAQEADIQIDDAVNIRELLCFQPNTNDISGETAIRVKLSENIKKKITRYNWTIGNYGIKLLNPKQESVIIQAVNPGLSSVKYEAFDKNNNSLGKVEIPLSVPQFFYLKEYTNYSLVQNALPDGIDTAKAREFDEVLRYARLQIYHKEIYKKASETITKLFNDINVRLVWAEFGQKLPKSLDPNKIIKIRIGGFANNYFDWNDAELNQTIGLSPIRGQWGFITMGRVADVFTIFAKENKSPDMKSYEELIIFLKDKAIPESRKSLVVAFWKEVFYKIFGFAIAHEIGHTLGLSHTNISKYQDDLMGDGYDDGDIGLNKRKVKDWRTFPLPGTYKWGSLKGFNEHNLTEIQKTLPVTSDSRFKPFFSLEN